MADVTSEVVVDAGEWVYVDVFGVEHSASGGFNLLISDDGASDVQYNFVAASSSMVTSDGYKLEFQPRVSGGNIANQIATLADATTSYRAEKGGINGELDIKCPVSGIVQHWKIVTLLPTDVDYGSAGTISATFEDQFGNTMSWVAGINVDTAA